MNNNCLGKILIVDDEKENVEVIKDILEDVNYKVVITDSADKAKVIINQDKFDLLLMDVWMPGQDGIALLEELINSGCKTPIAMMSGHAESRDIVKAIQLGAVDFLKKPLQDLLPTVRDLLIKNNQSNTNKINGIDFSLKMKDARNIFEKQYLLHNLKLYDNNVAIIADKVGIEKTTLYRKLKDLGIDKK